MNNNTTLAPNSNGDSKGKTTFFTIEQLFSIIDNVPICISVVNEKAEGVYCNAYTVDMYALSSKREFLDNFYNLTPETQPDGRNSRLAFGEHVLDALEKGSAHFSWLDMQLSGEELPLHISLYKLGTKDENGEELLVCTMRDLRPQLAGYEEEASFDEYYYSRISYKELFNTVAELSDEWFWIYDVRAATIQFFGKGRAILGLLPGRQPFPSYVVDSGMVYPDDLDAFLEFDQNLKTGTEAPVEVRFVLPSGVARYYGITYKTVYSKEGAPIFSIGKTYDIDEQKKLEVLSRTDLLTNCLNKITTENVVKDILTSSATASASHAMFLIDVDDFKAVNDDLGHYFGDLVLSDIAKNLHSNFRGGDVIGRIGGDEFLVFVQNISDEKVIKDKAKAIAAAFKNSYSGENNDYKISGSIGVALYPGHAANYEELYKCADKALYNSKQLGKDRYIIYSDDMSGANTQKLTDVDHSTKLANSHFDTDITSAVFELMYDASDVSKSMNTVVRLVGTHLGADRCYVAQTFDNGKNYSITFEWALKTSLRKKDLFQNIDAKDLRQAFSALKQGELITSNMPFSAGKGLPGFGEYDNAYLLTQTRCKGHTRLILGIDDSNPNRVWSEKEISTVQYILKLVSLFIAASDK